ncbi:MAG TPA: glycosyl hydrolase family 28 protein [Candidatus Aquilonibacter sp.]|nr:glycosyl hydrolase family 28 protein [Candidatus Aquilonibacter sp.]
MPDTDKSILSRREWMKFAVPVAAASTGAGLLAARAFADGPPAANDNSLGARIYNIRDFGAVGDGKTLDTAAVQAAIAACTKDQGGVVLVPAGVFVIGTVEMKSNVTLRIAAGGKLLGSGDGKQYYAAEAIPLSGDATLGDGHVGLIFAVNAVNITIEGPGTIDGNGALFRSAVRGELPPSGRGGADRPYHLLFYRCQNLRVRDLFLVASAYHSIRIIESQFVWLTGLHIYNRVNGNNDGFHFISAEYLHVENCDVQSQDDACALFGSCKFVTVTNSTFSTRWSVFRFIGGNPENITISNCVVYETWGCPIKMQFWGSSQVQNLLFSDLIFKDVTGPISININPSRGRGAEAAAAEPGGFVRNLTFQNIRATVVAEPWPIEDIPIPMGFRPGEMRQCVVLNCLAGAVLENVNFDNFHATFGGGGTAEEALREVPQIANEYFEIGTPPVYGIFARNVRGLTLNNVRFEVEKPDLRPAVMLNRVSNVAVNGISMDGNPQAASVLRLVETSEILISAARLLTPAKVFLQVEGAGSKDIVIDRGDLTKAAAPASFMNGAGKDAVKWRV